MGRKPTAQREAEKSQVAMLVAEVAVLRRDIDSLRETVWGLDMRLSAALEPEMDVGSLMSEARYTKPEYRN